MPKVIPAPARKHPRAGPITLERVADAAFAIVDAEGAAGLSARGLASQLGCEAMSLYHHVPNMDAVLDLVVGRLLAQCTPPALDAVHWRRQLLRATDDYLAMATRHPRVFALAAGRRWVTPPAYALAAAMVALFQAGGLSPARALRAARVLGAYLNGAGMALAGWKLSAEQASTAPAIDSTAQARKLRQRSNAADVRVDLNAGLRVVIDGLVRAKA